MAIDVEWQDEDGRCVARYDGSVDHRLVVRAGAGSYCLRFIDPHGDTTFNQAQVAELEIELSEIAQASDDVADQAKSLLRFIASVEDRTHQYLKFTGD